MNLRKLISDFFGGGDGGQPPRLRNKPNGLAFINSKADEGGGTGAIVGRYVTTRRLVYGDMWEIDPPQFYVSTANLIFHGYLFVPAGSTVRCWGVRDESLTPVPGLGLSAQESPSSTRRRRRRRWTSMSEPIVSRALIALQADYAAALSAMNPHDAGAAEPLRRAPAAGALPLLGVRLRAEPGAAHGA
jgi:hypothetical protein